MTRTELFNIIRIVTTAALIAVVIFAYWRLDTTVNDNLNRQLHAKDSLLINAKQLETNIKTLRDSITYIKDSLTVIRKRETNLRNRLNYITYEFAKQSEAYSKLSEDSMINRLNENK